MSQRKLATYYKDTYICARRRESMFYRKDFSRSSEETFPIPEPIQTRLKLLARLSFCVPTQLLTKKKIVTSSLKKITFQVIKNGGNKRLKNTVKKG